MSADNADALRLRLKAGYAVRGDVRKRIAAHRLPHPDPAVCELIAEAWDKGYRAGAHDNPYATRAEPNPYRETP